MMSPKIAIVGSGPGGLTLARLLYQAGIPFTIFDRRSEPGNPSISGSLDLHTESGLRALQAAGLYDKFLRLTRPGSEDTIITDKTGHVCFADNGARPAQSRPEIDRAQLTHLLTSSIPDSLVQWGFKIVSIEAAAQNRWTLKFENHHEALTFDLVVGADGAWSRARKVLTDAKPHYSGINCITLAIPSILSNPKVAQILGDGKLFALGDRKALIAQRGSTESVCIYAMLSSPAELYLSPSQSGLDSISLADLKERLVVDPKYFGDWGNDIKEIVLAASEDPGHYIQPKPLFMLPVGHTWQSKPGVTLLGDAAHLMTPFAGEGVNVAMLDALELAECIIAAINKHAARSDSLMLTEQSAWEDITQIYERGMFLRAGEKMRDTQDNMEMLFAEDAPRRFVEMMESHGPKCNSE
jgi:2-polyprenyl-6-methoxyphenol hydroxylase-like FAD-dependent oxidoreductase